MRRLRTGDPEPLGLTLVPGGANVAVFSAHATAIELCLFDASGQTELERIRLPERTGDVFHGFVPGIAAGARYGLRAHGPYDPARRPPLQRGQAARRSLRDGARPPVRAAPDALRRAARRPDAQRRRQRAVRAQGHRAAAARARAEPGRVRVPWPDTVALRAARARLHAAAGRRAGRRARHLRGPRASGGDRAPAAPRHHHRRADAARGGDRRAAPRARSGSPTTGATTRSRCCAPDPRLAPGGRAELAAAIAALHAAGIEVVLDVVLNHTGEGDALGPTLSLRGLDNATYYRLAAGGPRAYVNDTGCGNTLALDRPPVLRLALDALRHFAAMGVDGFRFDLATTLGRARTTGFDPAAPLLQAIAQDPAAARAEADRRALGHRPRRLPAGRVPGRAGASGTTRYRDTVRRFWRGDRRRRRRARDAARRLGRHLRAARRARRRARSTSSPRTTASRSPTSSPTSASTTRPTARTTATAPTPTFRGTTASRARPTIPRSARRARATCGACSPRCSSRAGTPMLAMGDELGRTQQGNNNAYAQDNALAWVDWARRRRRAVRVHRRARRPAPRASRAARRSRAHRPAAVDASGDPRRRVAPRRRRDDDRRRLDRRRQPRARRRALRRGAPATCRPTASRWRSTPGSAAQRVRWPEPRPGMAWRIAIDTALPAGTPAAPMPAGATTPLAGARGAGARRGAGRRRPRQRGRRRRAGRARAPRRGRRHRADVAGRDREAARGQPRHHARAARGDGARRADDRPGARAPGGARRRRASGGRCRRCASSRAGAPGSIAAAPTAGRRDAIRPRCGSRSRTAARRCCPSMPTPRRRASSTAADGRDVVQRRLALPPLPAGYHTLVVRRRARARRAAIVSRRRAATCRRSSRAGGRRFGVAAHLYALRRAGDQGIGDFTSLARARRRDRARGRRDGRHQSAARAVRRRSRAREPLPSVRPALPRPAVHRRRPRARARRRRPARARCSPAGPRRSRRLSRAGRRRLPRRLGAEARGPRRLLRRVRGARRRRRRSAGRRVRSLRRRGRPTRCATSRCFEAIAAAHAGRAWPDWPAGLRSPDGADVAAFAAAQRARPALRAVPAVARRPPARRRGARPTRARPALRSASTATSPSAPRPTAPKPGRIPTADLARGVSIGAPPDPLAPGGQVWCLPPPIPGALTASGYAGFRELARRQHAPRRRAAHRPRDGPRAPVLDSRRRDARPTAPTSRYPRDDLLRACSRSRATARAASSSARTSARCPTDFRERLAAARHPRPTACCGSSATGAAFQPPAHYPAEGGRLRVDARPADARRLVGRRRHRGARRRSASIDDDAADTRAGRARRRRAGARRRARRRRRGRRAAAGTASRSIAADAPHTPAVTAAIHRYAGASPSALVLVQADDLARRDRRAEPARHRPRASELAAQDPRRRRRIVGDAGGPRRRPATCRRAGADAPGTTAVRRRPRAGRGVGASALSFALPSRAIDPPQARGRPSARSWTLFPHNHLCRSDACPIPSTSTRSKKATRPTRCCSAARAPTSAR